MNKESNPQGMNKEIQDRICAKFDPDRRDQAKEWLVELTGVEFEKSFQEELQSGVYLCNAINVIKPKTIKSKKISKNKNAFACRSNIEHYLKACVKLGVPEGDNFETNDLYDDNDIGAVVSQLFSLGAACKNVDGYEGPSFGVKYSDKNVRNFSEETLREGRKIVPLQSAGSIQHENKDVLDNINLYGRIGEEMGKSVDPSGVSQQNMGSIQVEREKRTDQIVRYGKDDKKMSENVSSEISQQNAGGIEVDKGMKTDHIVKYGNMDSMMTSSSVPSQQSQGALETDKGNKLDSVSRALN